jgi:hypothetical protein
MAPILFSRKSFIGLCCCCLVIFLFAEPQARALAQCDYPPASTCYTCHAESYPVFDQGEWHAIHARKDCCWNCHGGNAQAQDKDLAHQGMVLQPLNDTFTDCYACHPSDYQERAERFGVVLGMVPISNVPAPQPTLPSNPHDDLRLVILPTPAPVAGNDVPLVPELFYILVGAALVSGLYLYGRVQARHLDDPPFIQE